MVECGCEKKVRNRKLSQRCPAVRKSLYTRFIKRGLDVMLSGIGIALLSPVLVMIVVMEWIFHGPPVLFVQKRPGLHGKLFNLYKFRTMTNQRDKDGVLLSGEERLTRFGKLLRRFSLDELPELFCIFTGKMSVIGPRPLLPQYLKYYTKRHRMRHEVRPGLACVPLKPLDSWSWNDQFENDIYYVENCSFVLDVKMMLALVKEAFLGREYRVCDTREEFNGTNLYQNAYRGEANND